MGEMDLGGIKANIRARKAAEDLLEFVPDVLDGGVDEDRFWYALAKHAANRAGHVLLEDGPQPHAMPPMSEMEAMDFESEVVPWGKHAGEEVIDVPPGYWLAVREGEFNRRLVRYLRSTRFKERQ